MVNGDIESIYNFSHNNVVVLLINFWTKYRQYYPDYKRAFLDKAIFHEFKFIDSVPDVLLEIYIYLNVVREKYDVYTKMINFYEEFFSEPFNKNIIEIGSGNLPNLAHELQKRINCEGGTGHVIGYDPELAVMLSGVELRKELFNLQTDVSNVDVLLGLYPCEGTEVMLDKALREKKELCLRLCDCIPDVYENQLSYEEWLNYLYKKIVNNIDSGFEYDYIFDSKDNKKIITLKRK